MPHVENLIHGFGHTTPIIPGMTQDLRSDCACGRPVPWHPTCDVKLKALVLNAGEVEGLVVTRIRIEGVTADGQKVLLEHTTPTPLAAFLHDHESFGVSMPRHRWRTLAMVVSIRNDGAESVIAAGGAIFDGYEPQESAAVESAPTAH